MNMTPDQALSVLDAMTQPGNAARLTRADYVNAEFAIGTLRVALAESPPAPTPAPEPPAATPPRSRKAKPVEDSPWS